ncbi:thymine dioxygenase [Gautieria morchelliformis]|nr:thymine dioxygenase [Gautieria morchelliformis]
MPGIKLGAVADGDISVLDFKAFVDGSHKQEVADAMLESLKDTGFVYLANHSLPKNKIDDMFKLSKSFFDLPLETKHLAPHPPSGQHHRGYSAMGVEKISQHRYDAEELAEHRTEAPDAKESFDCGDEESNDMPNIWLPDGILSGFKESCLEFIWLCHELELLVMRALALGFHLPEDYFLATHTGANNQLRLLHYPSVSIKDLEQNKITRVGAHSDFGSITLLMQDRAGGLEIEDPQRPGNFIPAPYIEDAIIVNAGDFLMRWSNDTIKSAVHRVHMPHNSTTLDGMTVSRYSIPYDFDKVVDCLPGTWSEDRPKRYDAISAGEYIKRRMLIGYK